MKYNPYGPSYSMLNVLVLCNADVYTCNLKFYWRQFSYNFYLDVDTEIIFDKTFGKEWVSYSGDVKSISDNC